MLGIYFNKSLYLEEERMFHKNKFYGFTLAEVLITLVIIGVIAAITVPSLINKTNNQETVSRLKKAYSTMAQATNRIIMEEGTPKSSSATSEDGWAYSSENMYNLYKKYLHNAKECGSSTGCFTQGEYKHLNGTPHADFDTYEDRSRLVLSDGTQVMFQKNSPTCSNTVDGATNRCALIWVDLNGAKKPNTIGRDLFFFVIKENGLYPNGCDDERYCDAASTTGNFGKGYGCACKVLREGAINY